MATIRVTNNIFKPSTFDYYIIPDKIVYSNMTATLGSGWVRYDNVEWIEELEAHAVAHTFGFPVPANGTASVTSSLQLRFANAAQNTSTGQYYDVLLEISNVEAQSRSQINRKTSIIRIDESEAWLQAFNIVDRSHDQFNDEGKLTNDPKPLLGIQASISISILGVSAGSFPWPFTDIDVRYDIVTDTYTIGASRVESATPVSDCSEIFVKTNTWLTWQDKSIDTSTPGSTQTLSLPIRFYNGVAAPDDSQKGDDTGIVCTCSATGALFTWTGSDCGTSFKGEGLEVYTIRYNANGGTGTPANQYKTEGISLQLTSSIPTYNITLTYDANGLTFVGDGATRSVDRSKTFRGWSTSKARADAGQIDYAPGASYTVDSDIILYASWTTSTIGTLPTFGTNTGDVTATSGYRFDTSTAWTRTRNSNDGVTSSTELTSNLTIFAKYEYLITLDTNGGYVVIGSDPPSTGPVTAWKKVGATYSVNYTWIKSGYNMLGFNTSPTATTASYPAAVNYSGNAPLTLYATWQVITYTVTFHDGYSPAGQDVLKTVNVPHGQSVPESEVPVEGQIYHGKVFKKPGLFHLVGWAGDYTRVTSDRDIIAIWDFVPIWVKVGTVAAGKWIKYEPIEQ